MRRWRHRWSARIAALASIAFVTAVDAHILRFAPPEEPPAAEEPADNAEQPTDLPSETKVNPADTAPDTAPPRRPTSLVGGGCELLSERHAQPRHPGPASAALPGADEHLSPFLTRIAAELPYPDQPWGSPRARLGGAWQPTGPPA